MEKSLTLLGIESSCDETAAAIVRRHPDGKGEILAQRILSQLSDHEPFGGVVPEIAARQHILHLDRLIAEVMSDSALDFSDLGGIAATAGPGLLGGVLVGINMAKALALALNKPFLAINHLEGHALTPGLTDGLRPPYLLLLVSGGHTQLISVENVNLYQRLGTTLDDALGEAFDKVAKLLDLPYPGGPHIERLSLCGNSAAFDFPRPLRGKDGCNFSFSGLKTAVRMRVSAIPTLTANAKADIAASFQRAVIESLKDRVTNAMKIFGESHKDISHPCLVIAGGVAANKVLRSEIEALVMQNGWSISLPPIQLCTDNAAMIAWAGAERLHLGLTDELSTEARARWPLDASAKPVHGAGVKA